LLVVTQRQLDRIPDIAQPALLGPTELHAPRDLAAMHIEAGNDTFRDHPASVAHPAPDPQ
jgi:hypothetical protein